MVAKTKFVEPLQGSLALSRTRRRRTARRGSAAAEFAVLAGGIALAVALGATLLGGSLKAPFEKMSEALSTEEAGDGDHGFQVPDQYSSRRERQ